MLKQIAQKFAFVLAFAVLVVPAAKMFSQSPSQVVTGTNPMPTGEDVGSSDAMVFLLLSALATV